MLLPNRISFPILGTLAMLFFQPLEIQGAEKGEAERVDLTAPAATPVREIIVVCKNHFDIGYTHRVKDVVHYYQTAMIDRALEVMDKFKDLPPEEQFAWTIPGWVMAKVLDDWPGQTPHRRQRLEQAFKSGKFIAIAVPFTVQSEFMEAEEFARGFGFASSACRKYGLPLPGAGKMTDVPCHTRALATALAQGGVRFMHIGSNSACSYPELPPLFWWEGPDGSRVLTMYSAAYGSCDALYPQDWLCTKDPKKDGCLGRGLLPPAGWPYKTWVAIIVTPENTGPPSADAVKALFDETARKLPGVKVRMGKMEDFADAILAEHPDLPVIKGETPDTWIHGIMCDPGGTRTARNVRPLMPAVEALNTQLRGWGLDLPDPAEKLAQAYEQSILFSEHTWGGAGGVPGYGEAFKKVRPAAYADLEGSWEDKTDYIRNTAKIVMPLLDAHLAALAGAVKCEGPRVVVYNPLPWQRSGVVSVKTTATAVTDLATGKVVPVSSGRFLATDVPASGYKTYSLENPAAQSSPRVPVQADALENEFFKVTLDPEHGKISSLIDKRTGRQWVDGAAAPGLGQYLNERFDLDQTVKFVRAYQNGRTDQGGMKEWLHPALYKPGMPPTSEVPYRAASPRHGTVRLEHDNVGDTAIMELPGDPANHLAAVTLRVALYRAQPYIDLELTIHDKAKDSWPEADWLCLPFKIASPTFCVGRTLGTMNPATDIIPGANRHLYVAGSGVTIADSDGDGIGVCSPDCPLISLDTPGCWKFSRDFVPKKPIVFFNLYNNQWNSNYRYWYPGTWSSRVRLWTFDHRDRKATALIIPSLETRLPLLAAVADGPAGKLPATRTGLAVSRPGVLVTAFGTDPDGVNRGTLLRVWNQSGVSGPLQVRLPAGLKATRASQVNLRGERSGGRISIVDRGFTFNLGPYAPASFILQ